MKSERGAHGSTGTNPLSEWSFKQEMYKAERISNHHPRAGSFPLPSPSSCPPLSQPSSASLSGTRRQQTSTSPLMRKEIAFQSGMAAFLPALHIVLPGEQGEEAGMGHCLQFKWLDLRKNQ